MSAAPAKPTFDDEHKFITSYLIPTRPLGLLRLLFGLYALVTNIVVLVLDGIKSGKGDEYLSYFTHLSYIGITAWFFASGVQSLAFGCCAKNVKSDGHSRYPLQSWPRPLQFLHKLLYATAATFPILVTVVYWVLLASSDSFSTTFKAWTNISQHILNTVFILFEILCTNLPPLEWIQLPLTILILALYLGLAYLTFATQGFYTYSFLDPKKQGAFLAAYIAGIGVGEVVVFVIVRYVVVAREYLTRKSSSRF